MASCTSIFASPISPNPISPNHSVSPISPKYWVSPRVRDVRFSAPQTTHQTVAQDQKHGNTTNGGGVPVAVDPGWIAEEDSQHPRFDPDWCCIICHCLPLDPTEVPCCGKIGCRSCLTEWIKHSASATYLCPICRHAHIASNNPALKRSAFVASKISGLTVKCQKCRMRKKKTLIGADGSTWRKHQFQDCDHLTTTCINCTLPCTKSNLQNHHSNECSWRLVTCNHCGTLMRAHQLSNHLQPNPGTDFPPHNSELKKNTTPDITSPASSSSSSSGR